MAEHKLVARVKRSDDDDEETLVFDLDEQPWPSAMSYLAGQGIAPDAVVSIHETTRSHHKKES